MEVEWNLTDTLAGGSATEPWSNPHHPCPQERGGVPQEGGPDSQRSIVRASSALLKFHSRGHPSSLVNAPSVLWRAPI